jgi:hypothetical protein
MIASKSFWAFGSILSLLPLEDGYSDDVVGCPAGGARPRRASPSAKRAGWVAIVALLSSGRLVAGRPTPPVR